MDIFGALADDATAVIALAHEEARALDHNHVGPAHILVGAARQDGPAAEALRALGVRDDALREKLEATFGRGKTASEHVYFIPRGRLVVELGIDEARKLGAERASTAHLVLGVVRDSGSEAGLMLRALGVTPEAVRERILARLGGGAST